jgi:hypothetical protein
VPRPPESRIAESDSRLAKIGEWLFLAWVALIPVGQPNFTLFERFSVQAADLVFVPAAMVYAALLFRGERRLRFSSTGRWAVAYLAALILSTCASEDRRQSFLKLLAFAYLIVAAVMAESWIANLEALRKTVLAWLAGTAVTVAAAAAGVFTFYYSLAVPAALRSAAGPFGAVLEYSHYTFIDDYGTAPPGPYPRICACFLYANGLCSYAIVSAMIVLAARRAGWIGRRLSHALFLGIALTSVVALSPGTGGIFLALGLWYWRTSKSGATHASAGRLAACAGVFAAAAFLLVATISPGPLRTGSLWETLRHPQPSARDLTWSGAWRTFLSHPVLGRGLDLPVAEVHFVALSGQTHNLEDAHDTWLSIMAQAGLPAVIAFGAMILTLVRRSRWRSPDSNPALAALDIAFLAGVLYQSLTVSLESTRHVWLAIALLASAHRVFASAEKPAIPPAAAKAPAI